MTNESSADRLAAARIEEARRALGVGIARFAAACRTSTDTEPAYENFVPAIDALIAAVRADERLRKEATPDDEAVEFMRASMMYWADKLPDDGSRAVFAHDVQLFGETVAASSLPPSKEATPDLEEAWRSFEADAVTQQGIGSAILHTGFDAGWRAHEAASSLSADLQALRDAARAFNKAKAEHRALHEEYIAADFLSRPHEERLRVTEALGRANRRRVNAEGDLAVAVSEVAPELEGSSNAN